jgi:BirA family biotin operon repressor/biotin-[acetyl-CoA-carboxylase] ligase
MDDVGGSVAVLLSHLVRPCAHGVVRTVAETGSTNADMLAAAAGGVDEGWWLRAERQAAGRGRQGREWVSPLGNFHGSTIIRLRPTDPPASSLALVAAVALQEAAATFLAHGAGATIKWPNDLLIDGAKVAGILLERAGGVVVIGMGVNLMACPERVERRTTHLAEHGASVSPDLFGETLAEAFARWLGRWRGEGLAPVRQRWLERAHPLGTALAVHLPDGTTAEGLFDGLDGQGALVLRLAGGERRIIHAADVFLL